MPVSPVCVPSPNVGTHGYITIVDSQGYAIGTVAANDGALYQTISGESVFLYNGGGPLDTTGVPSQQAFDRLRSVQGKTNASCTINATANGDMTLVCSSGAMASVMPGQAVKLSGVNGEFAYISTTYVPSITASSLPLQKPLVAVGNTTASWDAFSNNGPLSFAVSAAGLLPTVLTLADNQASCYRLALSANYDTVPSDNMLAIAEMRYNGGNVSERLRTPNVFKAFNAQAVTAISVNTPTSIWTPAAGKKFRLMGYWFSTSAAAGLVFHDLATIGGTGLLSIPSPIVAAAGLLQSPVIGNGVLSASANNKLWIDATAATTLTGFCWGTEE